MAGFYLTKLKEFIEKIGGVNSLALLSDLNIKTIYSYQSLKAKASVRSTQKIAKALGVTVDALGGEDVRRPRVKDEGLSRPAYRLTQLGAVLRSKKITRKAFALQLNIRATTLAAICQGQNKLTWQEVQQIAQLLSVEPEELGYYETSSRSDLKNWRKARVGGK